MKKKPSKSTAKRSAAKPARKRVPVDAGGHTLLFDPRTGEPTFPAPRLSAAQRARIKARERERRQASRERAAARRAAFNARLGRRPVEMQRDGYVLPADVAAFLKQLWDNPLDWSYRPEQITVTDAREMIEEAYAEGCREGFIEGFLYGEDKARPGALKNRERLRQQNLKKLERLGIVDRNAEIVAEFHRMERDLPGKEQRYEELAARHELTTRQIGTIIRKASTRRR